MSLSNLDMLLRHSSPFCPLVILDRKMPCSSVPPQGKSGAVIDDTVLCTPYIPQVVDSVFESTIHANVVDLGRIFVRY